MADHSILDPSIGFLVVTDDGLIQTPLKDTQNRVIQPVKRDICAHKGIFYILAMRYCFFLSMRRNRV